VRSIQGRGPRDVDVGLVGKMLDRALTEILILFNGDDAAGTTAPLGEYGEPLLPAPMRTTPSSRCGARPSIHKKPWGGAR
jgi:hypothetical protein